MSDTSSDAQFCTWTEADVSNYGFNDRLKSIFEIDTLSTEGSRLDVIHCNRLLKMIALL